MAEPYEGLIGLGREIIRKSRLSNAMGVPLIFVAIVFIGGLIGYIATSKEFFFWVMGLPVVFFMVAFIIILIFKPALLRTEEHEERMLQIASGMGQKGEELSSETISELPLTLPEEVQLPGNGRKGIAK